MNRRKSLAARGMLVLATALLAALKPQQEYRDARDAAQFHVQIEIELVEPPGKFPGYCRVHGNIRRVFRATASLPDELPVILDVHCRRPDDFVPPGGILWTDWQALTRARYVEAYLNREGRHFLVAGDQIGIIEALSDEPSFAGRE